MKTITEAAEYSFDTTDFGSGGAFRRLLSELGLGAKPVYGMYKYDDAVSGETKDVPSQFQWKGSGLIMGTSYNPLTGKKAGSSGGGSPGLAGYISLKGSRDRVIQAVHEINARAEYVKDQDDTQYRQGDNVRLPASGAYDDVKSRTQPVREAIGSVVSGKDPRFVAMGLLEEG